MPFNRFLTPDPCRLEAPGQSVEVRVDTNDSAPSNLPRHPEDWASRTVFLYVVPPAESAPHVQYQDKLTGLQVKKNQVQSNANVIDVLGFRSELSTSSDVCQVANSGFTWTA